MKYFSEFIAIAGDFFGVLIAFTLVVCWLGGIAIAKGFWSTTIAMCMPPYAWYLVVEKWLSMMGWL